jgi:hypothetical protein
MDNWLTEFFFAIGPEAAVRRARALPLIAPDGTRVPTDIISGSELSVHEIVGRYFFGEA